MGIAAEHRGKWPSLLIEAGFNPSLLNGRQHPCPMCGGKDRFRYDNVDGQGTYYCNQCGAGDSVHLMKQVLGWDFKEVFEFLNQHSPTMEAHAFRPTKSEATLRANLNSLWKAGRSPAVAINYLRGRGISTSTIEWALKSGAILSGENIHFNSPAKSGEYPAMLALVVDKNLLPMSIHRTYISDLVPKGERKKLMPPVRKMSVEESPAIVMKGDYKYGDNTRRELVIGEGIETTLAGRDLLREPRMSHVDSTTTISAMWDLMREPPMSHVDATATISALWMAEHQPDMGYDNYVILADNDASFTGAAVAFRLAKEIQTKLERRKDRGSANGRLQSVEVLMPRMVGWDMLDVMRNGGTYAVFRDDKPVEIRTATIIGMERKNDE